MPKNKTITTVHFNEEVIVHEIEYYDRYNWDLVDSWRKHDEVMSKWERIISNLIDKHQV